MQLAREPNRVRSTTMQNRYTTIGVILMLALFAFEAFNFDTTQYALTDLMGDVRFAGVKWATILAVAFCGIDFAGLLRVFTPDEGADTPTEVWYLMAAWLLGATMNAVMTWYAMSLALSQHHIGNEILTEQQLIRYVPMFVAFLVWLTRILFIGALSMAGNRIMSRAFRPISVQPYKPQQAHVRAAPSGYRTHRPTAVDELEIETDSADTDPPLNAATFAPAASRPRQHARR